MSSPRPARGLAEVAPSMSEASTVPTFSRVYEDYFAFVWASARRLGVPDALVEDAVQEVFMIVHRRLGTFERRSSMKTWLFGIVRNVTRDVRRSVRRRSPHTATTEAHADPELLPAPPGEGPEQTTERSEENRILHNVLDALDDEKREVFVLAELEQFSVPEIAEALGINVNTVYSRHRLARQEFAKAAARYRSRQNAKKT